MGTDRFMSFATRDMERGEVVSLRTHGRPYRVACMKGRVWVTASGLAEDTLLSSGEEATYGGHRRIVIEALGESIVRLEQQPPSRRRLSVLAPQPAR